MAQRKRSARPRARGRKRRGALHAHHDAELAGLGLIGLGTFAACVLWFGLSGGPVAHAATASVGWAAYLVPLVAVPLGALMVGRSALVAVGPFRVGLAVGPAGLLTALGRAHGGYAGRGLEWLLALGIGTAGATIAGVLLAVVGALFLTGASLGAIVRRSGHAVRRSGRAVGRVRGRVRRRRARPASAARGVPPPADVVAPRQAAPVDAVHDYPDVVAAPPPVLVYDGAHADDEGEVTEDTQTSLFEALETPPPEYRLPDVSLLRRSSPGGGPAGEAMERTAQALLQCLANFGVEATVVGQISGPRVTRYELQLAPGTKVGKVAQLKDDLSYALATTEIRILAPIPGKQAVGVEVPNLSPNLVTLGDIFAELPGSASPLAVWLGKDISGAAVWTDLARMPHILIAGTTGSGKSGCINTILTSILLRATPDAVRLILIDPKRIELNYYESIPHLLTPVVSSPKEASAVLLNVVTEMERRYERLSHLRARSLPEANRALRRRGEAELPYLLVVIDELADLMMVSPQDVEDAIIRLAQKSRAVGIHLVLATQRPSVDVITGMIKANVPSRIAFAVSSQTDSRVILDANGAESLLGQGDMLFKPLGTSRLQRVQGAFVTEEEVALVVEACRVQREPEIDESFLEAPVVFADDGDADEEGFDPDEDPLLDRAVEVVVAAQTASVSLLQRRLRVGYTRAGRLIDMLERRGIISPYEGSKPRRVLLGEHELAQPADR
ncbi:MAG TPA: DNA translocase FtsK [Gaiellaceae bacterium]|nr:DNA translocase FtsK [Gaiellaceae bacterium]